MKVLGNVEASHYIEETDNLQLAINADYADGKIIMLTRREAQLFRAAQEALEGNDWDWQEPVNNRHLLQDSNLEPIFVCLLNWVGAKFATNALQGVVDKLNEQLVTLEGSDE